MAGGDVYISFGADTGPLEASFATARAEVRGLSAELNKTANEMRATGAAADSDLGSHLNQLASQLSAAKGHFSELNEEIKAHKAAAGEGGEAVAGMLAKFRQFSEGITGVHEAFSSAAETFAAAFAVDKIAEWVSETQEAGEKVERLSAQLGMSTAEVQQLGAMFKLTGTDADAGIRGIERMEIEIRRTNSSTSAAQAGLKALGIDIARFRAASATEQLMMLADAAQHFADGPAKTAAFEAINRNLIDLIPLLDRGREGLAELERTARATGVVLGEDDVKALEEAKEQSSALSLATTALSQHLEIELNRSVASSTSLLTQFVSVLDLAVQHMEEWGSIITQESAAEGGVSVSSADPLEPLRQQLAKRGKSALDLHNEALLQWAGQIPANLSGPTVHAKSQVRDFTTGRSGGGKGKADHSDEQEAREAYQTDVETAQIAAEKQLDALNNLARQHTITWDEWAKKSTAALETEKAAIEKAAQAAIASAGLTSIEKQRIMNDEARALAEIAKKEADDQAKAAEESQRAWDSFFKPFNNAVDRMVSSMTSGHQTIAQDLKKTLDSMLADVIKFFTNWALHQAEMVAQKLAGDQVMQMSTAAGDIFNLGALLGQAARAVSVDAGVTAAGVAANQAPILGPGAIAEGLGAGAVIAGLAGGIGSADIGMWEVPHDQLNLIHQGELVMPTAQASAFRSFLDAAAQGHSAGGGNVAIHPTTHFHLNAIDGPSTEAWMRQNGPGMVKALDQAVRHGAHLATRRLSGR